MSGGVFYFDLPFFGVRRYTIDGQGIAGSSYIFLYWISGTSATMFSTLLPQFYAGNLSFLFIAVYLWFTLATLISFINAMTSDPGAIALPKMDAALLSDNFFASRTEKQGNNYMGVKFEGLGDFQEDGNRGASDETYCDKCEVWRPTRSHHCRRCGVCVRRMDHHCPWINNCVGARNMYLFLNLLVYALLLSFSSLAANGSQLYMYEEPIFDEESGNMFVKYRKGLRILVCIMSVSMIVAMTALLYQMHDNLLSNRTMLETMREQLSTQTNKPEIVKNDENTISIFPGIKLTKVSQADIEANQASSVKSRRRNNCCAAYGLLCGGRPLALWLLPLELCYPPPVPKIMGNVDASYGK